ncbi:hypothetical protein [Methermicoccus shengliensis]|nr:hypothetical protein [Methermicoccus shengliensis]KUK05265.1 MAG: hypothetical protein XD46_0258 [Euryarchaeota archaeon 55_53]KUK30320.1 MAG: hypothetical protein XD62_0583 [Methanosarcinales archeaon 56_1174]MDI3487852.1 hypothetical protein [Methanosarcinales archaeon]MDN5294501.1 hypothetical protein [Methanosarcinales archaeon]
MAADEDKNVDDELEELLKREFKKNIIMDRYHRKSLGKEYTRRAR